MSRLFQPLLFLLARCTRHELIRQIEFLKAENEILRKRVPKKHIVLKSNERDRLLKLGAALGSKLKHVITIVSYQSYLRWQRKKTKNEPAKKMGRPKTPDEVRALILKIASETGWGYTRIMGELAKLGIKPPSKTTVQNILREGGHDPGPKRGKGTWEEFLKAHAETLWQCDFFSKRVLTRTGIKQAFVMAFINVATRRVIISPSTFKLGDGWIVRQTEAFFDQARNAGLEAKTIMRDNDNNYAAGFDEAVKAGGAQVRPTAVRAPNENAFVERFVQTIKQECLDHFLVFGQDHLDYLVREYIRYYHDCRPHQGIGNRLIRASKESAPVVVTLDQVRCESRLGGLLKTYVWAA
jgi:putative transposase